MYRREEAICQFWVGQKTPLTQPGNTDDGTSNTSLHHGMMSHPPGIYIYLLLLTIHNHQQKIAINLFLCITALDVLSQLKFFLSTKYRFLDQSSGGKTSPNLFVRSANQFADNAATQAGKIYENLNMITLFIHHSHPDGVFHLKDV
jgi:hypothetical protein